MFGRSDALFGRKISPRWKQATTDLKLAPFPIDSCAPAHCDLSVWPIYVARIPAAPFARRYPSRLYLLSRFSHQLDSRIWIGQNASTASCTVCPPWREVLWECEASSHRFSINGLLPKSDARTRAHSKSPATAGRNTTGENLRKLATASSSCGELRKLSPIVRMTCHPW
jgi:hypothetical protein